MNITLCINQSENNVINKAVTPVYSTNCILKKDTSAIHPIFELSYTGSLNNINYLIVNELNRCYFVDNIRALTGGRYEVSAHVDVLESYKNNILALECILDYTENTGKDNYLSGSNWVAKVKDKTDIISFENGLSENGEFILITAGGIA